MAKNKEVLLCKKWHIIFNMERQNKTMLMLMLVHNHNVSIDRGKLHLTGVPRLSFSLLDFPYNLYRNAVCDT